MSISGLKKEIQTLKKECAPNYKPIEVLLQSDPHTLTDQELFRLIQIDYPEFKSLDELTTEVLEKMVNGEYP